MQVKSDLKKLYLTLKNLGTWPAKAHLSEDEELLGQLRTLRICIVKQASYTDLASQSVNGIEEYLEYSNHRSGPYGWLIDFNADFRVVKCHPEANLWEQKLERGNQSHHQQIRDRQALNAESIDEIDFSIYDLVLTYECAVPASVTAQYPNVLWATMLEDHRMKEFAQFSRKPPEGYDYFFDQRFGPSGIFRQTRQHHVINFPYVLPHCSKLDQPGAMRDVVLMDTPHRDEDLKQFFAKLGYQLHYTQARSLKEHFTLLARCKYFISYKCDNPKWGNGFIEPAAYGCINIGDPKMFWNPAFITRQGRLSRSLDLKKVVLEIEQSQSCNEILDLQYRLIQQYCCYGPFRKLLCGAMSNQRLQSEARKHFGEIYRAIGGKFTGQ